jgi:hypothetical protein
MRLVSIIECGEEIPPTSLIEIPFGWTAEDVVVDWWRHKYKDKEKNKARAREQILDVGYTLLHYEVLLPSQVKGTLDETK